MKATLKRQVTGIYHYRENVRIDGPHAGLRGDVTGLRGDVSDLSGNVSGMFGDVSGLRGEVTDLRGDVTGLIGDVDDCEITDAERKEGVPIEKLIAKLEKEAE